MIDVKPLLAFATVLEKGSMNAAAKALGITPSAVSQHINRLEQQHNVKLLNRSTRKLSPTDAGLTLANHCLRLQHMLNDALQTLDNLKTEAVGELNISLPSGLATAPQFQRALQTLQQQYPEIHPQLYFDDKSLDLHNSKMDLAIRPQAEIQQDPNIIARHLTTWHWQICASPMYLQAYSPIAHPEDLYQHHWLYDSPISIELRKAAESHYLEITDCTWCNQLSAVQSLTLAGLGLSLQLSGEIVDKVAAQQLVIVLPEWKLPELDLYLVTPYRVQSAKTEVAVRMILEAFREVV